MNIDLEKLAKIIAKKNLYLTFEYNDSPAELYGGNWERVAENLTLWTTITQGEAGKIIAPGLPNIQGSVWAISAGTGGKDWVDGAFRSVAVVAQNAYPSGGSSLANQQKIFNAHEFNDIYGNSTTVQPPAIKVYVWKRIS